MENVNLIKELQPIKTQVSKAEAVANAIQIRTTEELTTATDVLGRIKLIGKQVVQKKEGITKPLNEALRSVRDFFRPIEEQWESAERIVKEKMTTYHNAEVLKADKKTDVIEQKVEAGQMSFEKAADKIEALTPQKTVSAQSGSIQFRTVKEVVIEDETKLPREFLIPDMVKIKKVVLAGVEIAGVKVVEKQIVAGTTR